MKSMLEVRAEELDAIIKQSKISSRNIDVDKYLHFHDVTSQVKDATEWLSEMEESYINPKVDKDVTMPWSSTHSDFRYRMGEVTVYAGTNGGGKSLITGQIALGLIRQGKKVCIASFEMQPEKTLWRMVRQFAGEFIDDPLAPDRNEYIRAIMARFRKFIAGKLFIYDQQGTTSPNKVIAMSRYCAMEKEITHIFIDSLMKCVEKEDDYNEQKKFVDELCSLARDHNVHVHLVHHIRKQETDEKQPNKNDLKGSGSIADQVDNVFLVWRNKKKENMIKNGETGLDDVADTLLMCEKQRNGDASEWYKLWYHASSQQFVEKLGAFPMDFDNEGRFRA